MRLQALAPEMLAMEIEDEAHGLLGAVTLDGPVGAAPRLSLRVEVRIVGGEEGRALAAAQGRALSEMLAVLAEMEVGQGVDHEGGTR